MAETIDCRNLVCPQPVVMTRNFLAKSKPEDLTVIVDNPAASENVSRFLDRQGYNVEKQQEGKLWRLSAKRADTTHSDSSLVEHVLPRHETSAPPLEHEEKILVLISSNFFGSGDDELGIRLMKNFLLTLPELGESLWRILLLNGGVKLAVNDSPVLEQLRELEKEGARIMVCGTCLDFFSLLDQKALGETTNMLDVVTSMQLADKVIRV